MLFRSYTPDRCTPASLGRRLYEKTRPTFLLVLLVTGCAPRYSAQQVAASHDCVLCEKAVMYPHAVTSDMLTLIQQELSRRGQDRSQYAATFAAKRNAAMQWLGVGAGMMMQQEALKAQQRQPVCLWNQTATGWTQLCQ